jgi:hypothetical protein
MVDFRIRGEIAMLNFLQIVARHAFGTVPVE